MLQISRSVTELDASMTQPGSLIGTPRYMSPEQAAGDLERVGPASDIYSLGAILYCLLVGHAPFMERTLEIVLDRVRRGIFPAPRRVLRSVDPTLEAVCLKAMALDPAQRHASALDLANELEAWQADVRYRGEQEQALSQVKGSLTRLCLERAHQAFGREGHAEGMLWLARRVGECPGRTARTRTPDPDERDRLAPWREVDGTGAAPFPVERRPCLGLLSGRTAAGVGRIGADRDSLGRFDRCSLATSLSHQGTVRALAFHPDGASLASVGDDGKVQRRMPSPAVRSVKR